MLKIFDMHCDVLYKMLLDPNLHFSDQQVLDVTHERLQEGNIKLQTFAIFLPEERPPSFAMIEQAIHLFHRSVLSRPGMTFIRTAADLQLAEKEGKIGALLSLEGADGLQGSMLYVRRAFELGVRCLGLTWNYANWAADGVLERRQAGLSLKGRELIEVCNEIGMIVDISHLNEPGFWEVMELSAAPVIASHSNCAAIEPHPRNLSDEQIKAIVQKQGRIGLTFVPDFIGGKQSIDDLLKHLDHICALGGEDAVGFGSDFDGIDDHVQDLAHPADYIHLGEVLLNHYSAEQTDKFLHKNWHQFLLQHLPS